LNLDEKSFIHFKQDSLREKIEPDFEMRNAIGGFDEGILVDERYASRMHDLLIQIPIPIQSWNKNDYRLSTPTILSLMRCL
jgi:hypothetical protein